MLAEKDYLQLTNKGIDANQIQKQLNFFKTGFPSLKISNIATTPQTILSIDYQLKEHYVNYWNVKRDNFNVVKFVPASGAASRMFKQLFEFCEANYNEPQTKFEKKFFENISEFAFYSKLDITCQKLYSKNIKELINQKSFKSIVKALLDSNGMNYGQLPKGTILFHNYTDEARTPIEEHLVEGAYYCKEKNGEVNIHFTVSPEHKQLFKQIISQRKDNLEQSLKVKFNISYSEQKSSTDTIGATTENHPFRLDDGTLFFRPGGHGALIENLNDLNADIIFIKNIDNVVPDSFKKDTITYKCVLAGILVEIQAKIFEYLEKLSNQNISTSTLQEILKFLENTLHCHTKEKFTNESLKTYLFSKLNRPIRVCGMVKNIGEPGGGPFMAYNADGTISPQILESCQIDMSDPKKKKMFEQGTHFNPVDIVCATKNFKGEKFNLKNYIDNNTGFISIKSFNGKELKALELPGLWNGAMSDWNTIFVEVPLSTFNPVKTVNDLLRPEHQNR